MPFDPKTARNAGKKSKRGPAKKRGVYDQTENGVFV
tara:strand:+ start:509 stop:616 length:108 start_codon:yes stop_codon:yes gene_type:complete